jgi:hypothetical protein
MFSSSINIAIVFFAWCRGDSDSHGTGERVEGPRLTRVAEWQTQGAQARGEYNGSQKARSACAKPG